MPCWTWNRISCKKSIAEKNNIIFYMNLGCILGCTLFKKY